MHKCKRLTSSSRSYPNISPTPASAEGEHRQESLDLASVSATIDTCWRLDTFKRTTVAFFLWKLSLLLPKIFTFDCPWVKQCGLWDPENEQNILHCWKCVSNSNKNLSKPLGGNYRWTQTLPSFITFFNSNCCSSSFPNGTRVDMLAWIWQIIENFHVIKTYEGPGTVSEGWVHNWEWDFMGSICWWLNYTTSSVTGEGLVFFKDFYYLPPPTRGSVSQLIIFFKDSWGLKPRSSFLLPRSHSRKNISILTVWALHMENLLFYILRMDFIFHSFHFLKVVSSWSWIQHEKSFDLTLWFNSVLWKGHTSLKVKVVFVYALAQESQN